MNESKLCEGCGGTGLMPLLALEGTEDFVVSYVPCPLCQDGMSYLDGEKST